MILSIWLLGREVFVLQLAPTPTEPEVHVSAIAPIGFAIAERAEDAG